VAIRLSLSLFLSAWAASTFSRSGKLELSILCNSEGMSNIDVLLERYSERALQTLNMACNHLKLHLLISNSTAGPLDMSALNRRLNSAKPGDCGGGFGL
jgi:hypothetical protein